MKFVLFIYWTYAWSAVNLPETHGGAVWPAAQNGPETAMSTRLVSDIGGKPAGDIPREERRQLFWEKQLIAVVNLLSSKLDITLDEFRRAVEEMSEEEYGRSYLYGRRLDGWLRLLFENGTIDADAHAARTAQILASGSRDHV
ncbi:nitrile hydratase subunit beta [Arenibacterium halophilum]|uniref:Nitrile hydratase subunit beta n=2 Tax=Arenibacterium halophilum TaxID=2583821 RepID=A0ABY2WZB3_9RHOB|nr:nitrile hydratase subunit beta [Arenibacterium halophilum]